MAKLKRRAKIERLGLLGNRLINRLNIVAKTASPKTRQAIKNFPAIAIRVVTPVADVIILGSDLNCRLPVNGIQ